MNLNQLAYVQDYHEITVTVPCFHLHIAHTFAKHLPHTGRLQRSHTVTVLLRLHCALTWQLTRDSSTCVCRSTALLLFAVAARTAHPTVGGGNLVSTWSSQWPHGKRSMPATSKMLKKTASGPSSPAFLRAAFVDIGRHIASSMSTLHLLYLYCSTVLILVSSFHPTDRLHLHAVLTKRPQFWMASLDTWRESLDRSCKTSTREVSTSLSRAFLSCSTELYQLLMFASHARSRLVKKLSVLTLYPQPK